MKIKHTPHAIAQLFQNSEFWNNAMWELRFEKSQIHFSRCHASGTVTADLFDRCEELHNCTATLSESDYRALVTKFMSHCGKHKSTIVHDVGFRPKRTKSIESLSFKSGSFKPLDNNGARLQDEPARAFSFESFAKVFQNSEKKENEK